MQDLIQGDPEYQKAWTVALDRIPTKEKQFLYRAQYMAPDIIQSESRPHRFLVACDYDYDEAAKKLCRYWKVRCETFEDLAFYPLKYGGALGYEEMDFLKLGALVIAPCDNRGRTVVLSNCDKMTDYWHNNLGPRMRATFALLNVTTENEMSQTEGLSYALYLSLKNNRSGFNRKVACTIIEWINNVFPLRFADSYVVTHNPSAIARFAMRTVINVFLAEYCFDIMDKLKVFLSATPEEITTYLLKTGLYSHDNLPICIGGEYDGAYGHELFQYHRNATVDGELQEYADLSSSSFRYFRHFPSLCCSLLQMSAEDIELMVKVDNHYPNLIKHESDPNRFLQFCNQNADFAASKLVMYWKTRHELFGVDAFKPLLLPSSQVLDEAEVCTLSTGCLELLPKDSRGRPVVYFDRDKVCGDADHLNSRCLFFFVQSVMNVLSNGRSSVLIFKHIFFDRITLLHSVAKLVSECFPFTMEFYFLCQTEVASGDQAAFTSLQGCAEFVFCQNEGDFSKALAKKGFIPRYLPKSIGGSWSGTAVIDDCETPPTMDEPDDIMRESSAVSDAAHQEFIKKQRLRLQARQKRERQKSRVNLLQSQVLKLSAENQFLKSQQDHLEGLLQLAMETVQEHQESTYNGRGMTAYNSPMGIDYHYM